MLGTDGRLYDSDLILMKTESLMHTSIQLWMIWFRT